MRKLFFLVLLFSFSLGMGKLWYLAKDGFHFVRLQASVEERGLAACSFDEETEKALRQTYRYLGKGRQCYAFESEDGQYVLKLPRRDIFRLPLWARATFLGKLFHYREKSGLDRTKRERFLRTSLQLSQEELKEQTALLALHLHPTQRQGRLLRIVDRLGYSYALDLDATLFALQRKTELWIPALERAIREGNQEQARGMLTSFLSVLQERGKKGILNKDASFLRNFGYAAGRVFQIDIGSFYRIATLSPTQAFERSIRESTDPVRLWLHERDPVLAAFFATHVSEQLTRR